MGEFRYEKDQDGIVTITMDMDGPINSMNAEFGPLFSGTVERLQAEQGLTGVILTSAKETFFAGGDLNWLLSFQPGQESELFAEVQSTKANMRALERLAVPVVAAINGSAAGGGFECALACHYRLAVNDRNTKIGLPEVTLGLLPGGGGVVRLTWILGLEAAMPFLLEGRMSSPEQALKAGLIHEMVATQAELLPRAKAWIQSVQGNVAAATQPWDQKGYRIPGGLSGSAHNAPRLAAASAMLYKKTRGLLPAPEMIMDIMAEAAGRVDFDTAMRYETRRFAALVPRPEAKNMISTFFFGMNSVKKGSSRPKGFEKSTVRRLGILGAGMMGQGIAYSAAMAGIPVVLMDIVLEAAERGKAYTQKLLDKRVEQGRMPIEQRAAVLAAIQPTANAADLQGCDLIIEAVFERIDLKDGMLAEYESLLAENGIWGSNTSTLPITRLASKAHKPENFVGLHFFSPVDKMPLLEIVVGEQTSDETLACAFDFAVQIRKTPIVVNDSTGFYTSRTIGTKMDEAVQMVAEGIDPVRVENLGRAVGFPTGMLTLMDQVTLKLAVDIYHTQVAMGLRDPQADPSPAARALLGAMVEQERYGRVAGGGFFDYTPEGKTLWPGLAVWRRPEVEISDQDIKDRMLFRAVIESLKCLEEGVLRSVTDGNVGSIMGIGAPVHTGGYLQFVNTYGLEAFAARCAELAERYGERFVAPEILHKQLAIQQPFV